MKIENRNMIIFKIVTTVLITITPVVASAVVFSEFINQKQCLDQQKMIAAIDLEAKPVITCEKNIVNLNLFTNKINQEKNNLNVTNFENQSISERNEVSLELASMQKFLSESKVNYKLPNSRSYTELLSNLHTLVRENKTIIDEASSLKYQLDTNITLLNEDDQKTAKSIVSLNGYNFLSEIKSIKELVNKATNQLLAIRDNKASIDEQQFLALKKKIKVFTPEQFLALSDSLTTVEKPVWNNTIIEPSVDKIIFDAAFKRGYKYRVDADIKTLTGTSETDINIDASNESGQLIASGQKDGFEFKIASGYRNPDLQKILLTSRLSSSCVTLLFRECTLEDFQKGNANQAIEDVLKTTSVPTLSKHHTGLTVDINETSGGPLTEFKNTKSYQYLSSDNFFNAKRFGFVPSYPVGGTNMGPDPEEWEFIYVGKEKLFQP